MRSELNAALAREQAFLCGIVKRGGVLSADDVCDALDRIWASATAAPSLPDRQRLADMFSQMKKDGKSWLQIADASRSAFASHGQNGTENNQDGQS